MESTQEVTPVEFRPVNEMTDSEKLDEILNHLRMVGGFLAQFQGMSPAQLIKMMLTGK